MYIINKKLIPLLILGGCILFVIGSCTSSRWVVSEKNAVDKKDYTLISSQTRLVKKGSITPENPVLELNLYHQNTYRYKEKILSERLIQEYKPRWTYTAVSLGAAAILFYSLHSDKMLGSVSQSREVMLNAAGGILTLSPILAMKPVGDPIKTGETQYGRNTGTKQITRLEGGRGDIIKKFDYSLVYQKDTLIQREITNVQDSSVRFNLVELVEPDTFDTRNPDSLQINVSFRDTRYHYKVGISEFLLPYTNVESEFATLRNKPSKRGPHTLTDLAKGSMLRLVNENAEWYEVKFGLKNTFILKEDVQVVWRPGTFEQKESIVTLDKVPFGEIDVESNIPVLQSNSPSGLGLILASEDYTNLSKRKYAVRDARLLNLYLKDSFGYQGSNIFRLDSPDSLSQVDQKIEKIKHQVISDTSELIIFISGHVIADEKEGEYRYYYTPISHKDSVQDASPESMDLQDFFEKLSRIDTYQTIVFADVSFHTNDQLLKEPDNLSIIRPLASIARRLTENHSRSAVIFSSKFNQDSHLYYQKDEVDKKHRIFPYFIAHALQKRIIHIADLMEYLERNVNYTSRKLHETPQNPQFFGNQNLLLINDRE